MERELVVMLAESVVALKQLIPHINDNTGAVGRLDERVEALEGQMERVITLMYEGGPQHAGVVQEMSILKLSLATNAKALAEIAEAKKPSPITLAFIASVTSIIVAALALITAWYT